MSLIDNDAAPPPLTPTDHALLLAARVWGERPDPGLWDLFTTHRRAALRWAWKAGLGGEEEAARRRLACEYEAQARPNLARVHVSWWARALKDEPASVRAAVIGHVPPAVAEAFCAELGLGPDDLAADRPAEPHALRTALALWTERLVGDLAEREDDPPVIVALAQCDAPTLTRLIRTTGLAKWSLTPSRPQELAPDDMARLDRLRERLGEVDPRFRQVAVRDVADIGRGTLGNEARLGLTTLARLLASADPYRVRWALQHLPYPTAKAIRTLMGPPGRRNPMLARWETAILRAGWQDMLNESRLDEPWRWETPT
jgi:hypothetical protein